MWLKTKFGWHNNSCSNSHFFFLINYKKVKYLLDAGEFEAVPGEPEEIERDIMKQYLPNNGLIVDIIHIPNT